VVHATLPLLLDRLLARANVVPRGDPFESTASSGTSQLTSRLCGAELLSTNYTEAPRTSSIPLGEGRHPSNSEGRARPQSDGIMALFGAPLAHEDHAVRACYAALRMQESVKRYAEGMRRQGGIRRVPAEDPTDETSIQRTRPQALVGAPSGLLYVFRQEIAASLRRNDCQSCTGFV